MPQLPGQYAFSYSLDYDGNGNRLHKYWSSGATDTYSYDSDDRLQSVPSSTGAVSSYAYDGYKRPYQIGSASNYKTLSWDIEDRLLSVSQGGSTLGSYAYNGAGARVRKTVGSTSHYLGRAGAGVTAPVVNDSANMGSPTNTVPGLMSQTGSVIHSFAGDQLGTRNHEIDGNGAVSTDREYDAFGNLLNPPLQGDSSFGYAGDWGYLEDAETGLKQVGCRVYDAVVGRFLTQDWAEQGSNWMAYCDNGAQNSVDPTGLGPTLLLIRGDRSGGVVIVDPAYDLLKKHFEKQGWTVLDRDEPSLGQAFDDAAGADAIWVYGHGARGKACISYEDYMDEHFVHGLGLARKLRGKGKLQFVNIDECGVCVDPQYVNSWLAISGRVRGYRGMTFEDGVAGKRETWTKILSNPHPHRVAPYKPYEGGDKRKSGS